MKYLYNSKMIINAYKTNKIGNSLTTYKIEIDNINLFLDFGSTDLNQGDFLKPTVIVLTHEHLDHWDGLVQVVDILYDNKNQVKLFSTRTTKLLIQELFDKYYSSNLNLRAKDIEKISTVISGIEDISFEQKVSLTERVSIELFPSGHTYGSSMVYIKCGDETLLYTSDVDYVKGDPARQYYFPFYDSSYPVKVLLLDATAIYRNYKSKALNEYLENSRHRENLDINVRPEKSLIFARILNEKEGRKVYILRDLFVYYKILSDSGYSPFKLNEIMFETDNQSTGMKSARISSIIGYKLDHKVGLHIGLEDAIDFVNKLKENLVEPRIYLTHYSWSDLEELKKTAQKHGFNVLNEGRTEL
jgi:glyoxylase-like metal-dependent hydrolase (beta-lactamase superfamily II)